MVGWRRRGGSAWALVLLAWALALPTQAQNAPPAYRFRELPAAMSLPLGPQVLSAEERAFVASLPEIRVAVPLPNSRPYEVIEPDGEVSGINVEMLTYLAKAFNLRLKPVVMPSWTATLEAARRREVDLLMTLGVTDERAQFLAFTLGATPMPGALFARVGTSPRPDPAHARFALERAYLANDFVHRQFPEATIVTVEDTGQALAAVAEGRADYHLGSLLETLDWAGRRPAKDIQIHRLMNFGTGHYHYAVRKDWAALATILNKGISTVRALPMPQLDAAMAALPASMALPGPVALKAEESALLVRFPVWRLGAVRGLPMLNDVDLQGLHSGIAAEYAEQVARRLGVGLQVVPFDNVGAMLDALREGRIDLVPFLTATPERRKQFAFSAPYVEMPYMIVARSDAPLYWDLGSLHGRRLALALQHPLRELLAREHPQIQVVDVANGNAAMDAVARGDADAAVEVKLFANLRINADTAGRLRAVAEVTELPAQFHFAAALGAQAGQLLPMVDRVVAELPAAERDRMLRRWVALDFAPTFAWRRHLPTLSVAVVALLVLGLATAWWMQRLRREARRRRRSEEQLHDIAAALPGVAFRYVVDAQHQLVSTYFSPGAADFLGMALTPGRTLLTSIADRLRPEHRQLALAAQDHSLRTGDRFKVTCCYRHPAGAEMWLHAEAVARELGEGQRAWTGYVVDVSSERDLQARLARQAQARHVMLASASHELRAPAHTASLALQSLDPGGLSSTQKASVGVAREALSTLAELLNDVLDAARMDGGELQLRPQAFALERLVSQIERGMRDWADAKGLAFDVVREPGLPQVVLLDPLRVRQIVTNLLSNAIKYTPSGRVELRVGPGGQGRDPRRLRFEVSDTGPGMAEDALARVFTPFGREPGEAAAPVRPPEGSSRLGLSISRRLATMMGGEVQIASRPGEGTRASVELPLPELANRHQGPVASGAVLVCDDDPVSRMLVAQMLANSGFDVVEAGDAAEALQRLRDQPVQALVTDVQMDGLSGLELAAALRASEQGRDERTRVLVCSGNPVPDVTADAAATAPPYDAYLAKPVDLRLLLDTLSALGVRPMAAAN